MDSWGGLARLLIITGLILVLAGSLFYIFSRLGLGWRLLPGDIVVRKGNFTLFFPIVTCIVLSIILSVVLSIFRH